MHDPKRKPARAKQATLPGEAAASGFMPHVFTWNGREFQFHQRGAGVAPLGASMGGGRFFPVDHDDTLDRRQGPRSARRLSRIRITEELREVAYLDQVRLSPSTIPRTKRSSPTKSSKGRPSRVSFSSASGNGTTLRGHPITPAADVLNRVTKLDRAMPTTSRAIFSGRAEMASVYPDFRSLSRARRHCAFSEWLGRLGRRQHIHRRRAERNESDGRSLSRGARSRGRMGEVMSRHGVCRRAVRERLPSISEVSFSRPRRARFASQRILPLLGRAFAATARGARERDRRVALAGSNLRFRASRIWMCIPSAAA